MWSEPVVYGGELQNLGRFLDTQRVNTSFEAFVLFVLVLDVIFGEVLRNV